MTTFNIKPNTRYRITGRTFDHEEVLKKMGANWDPATNSWLVRTGGPPHIDEQKSVLNKLKDCEIEQL